MSAYNFGTSGSNVTKLFHATCRAAGVFKWALLLGKARPLNFGRAKNVQNSARFLTTIDFDREYLRKGSTYRKSEKYLINYNPSHVGRKKVGELWSTNKKVIGAPFDPPKLHFSGDNISAFGGGCWPLKFLHTLEIDQGMLAHPPGRPYVELCPIFLVIISQPKS